jgi:hypothetical protein
MDLADDQRSLLSPQQQQFVDPGSSRESSRRSRTRRQTLPELIVETNDRAHSARMNESTTSASFSTMQETKTGPPTDESTRKPSRHAASSSSPSPIRRLSKLEQHRYAAGSVDTPLRRQSNPLRHRQKRRMMPSEDLPPTPVSAYYDVSRSSHEDDPLHRSVNLFSAMPAVSSSSIDSTRERKRISSMEVSSSTFNSDGISVDDIYTSDSLGAMTLSSEIDTPGPITPATPGWKPRELTLLKKSSDSSQDPIGRGADRDELLIGLGLQSPNSALFSTEDADRPRTTRLLAKDILPIANAAKRNSNLPSNGPRELKLASAGGPPSSARARSQPRLATSPLLPSFSQASKTSLPILPPGTAFSSDRTPASSSSNADTFKQDFAVLYKALDEESTRLTRYRKGSYSRNSSFSRRANSASNESRRKAPPATLDLSPSIASTYRQTVEQASDPITAQSTKSSLPHTESTDAGLLAVPPQGSQRAQYLESPVSAFSSGIPQSFHTPLQSPLTPGAAPRSAVMDGGHQSETEPGDESFASTDAAVTGDENDSIASRSLLLEENQVPIKLQQMQAEMKSLSHASERLSESTNTRLGKAAPPIASGVNFDTSIFTASKLGKGVDRAGQLARQGAFTSDVSPTASPRLDIDAAWTPASSEQRPRPDLVRHNHPRLSHLSSSDLPPTSALPILLVKSPSNEGTQLRWNQEEALESKEEVESADNIGQTQVIAAAQPYFMSKPVPPIPKPKLSLVPDVPSFGYTGPISSRSSEAPEKSSPITAAFFAEYQEDIAAASRWSSGSESEDEKSTAKSASKKSLKQRKNSGSASGQSAKKGSFSSVGPSESTASKKSGFFAGLGLRKKSNSSLSAHASPVMMFSASPASSKIDQMGEYPFPTSSPATYSRQSSFSAANSRRGSIAQMSSHPGLPSTSSDGPPYGHLQSSRMGLASSTSSAGSARPPWTVQPSDGNTGTSTHAQGSSSASARLDRPAASQTSSVDQELPTADQDYHRGLAIQMPPAEGHLEDVLRNETQASTGQAKGKPSRSSWRMSRSLPSNEQGESRGMFGLRKKSAPSASSIPEQRKSWRRSRSGPIHPPSEVAASPVQTTFSSPDETPRLPYATLDAQHDSHAQEEKPMSTIEEGNTVDGDADFRAIGQALRQMPWQAASSALTRGSVPSDKSSIRSRRVRVEGACAKPRYTSLTDVGRLWRDEHPDLAFGGAQGLDLLCLALSGGQQTSAGRLNGGSFGSGESDSETDDYGSSEGGAGGRGSGDGSPGGDGGEGNNGDDDKPFNRRIVRAGVDDAGDSSSSESEDSYGGSDEEGGPSAANVVRRQVDSSSGSSDDIPLGQRLRNPDQLQRQLRKLASKARKTQDISINVAARPEVPSNDLNFVLDANDLAARLTKVLAQREASEAQVSETPSLVSASVSRNRSMVARKAPTQSQVVTSMPSLAIQDGSKLQSRIAVAPIQTSNIISASRMQQERSSPISPGYRPSQPISSATLQSESSEASMKTALEAQPSSSMSQRGEEHRAAVIADFANTIKARSRSRSFALPFPPAQESGRPPPVPSRSVLVPQVNSVTSASLLNNRKREVAPEDDDTSLSSSSMASPKPRNASTGFKASTPSADDHENADRVRQTAEPSAMVQHRVYLINKQRCGVAEVEMNARSRDVVLSIMEREPMPPDSRSGGWVLYDVCAELGIERPIREYEMISEVIALRSSAQNDYFILKRTELAPYLSMKNVPNSSAALAGWIYIQENHRKRWNKRWLELRDNCLYLAKTEKGKDEALLCSLSSFDVYLTDSSKVKTPKQYSFALRSQNSINMFESPEADYVHYFALSDAAASRHWITAILNARTFVMRQEKSHLFRFNTQQVSASTPIAAPAMASGSASNEQAMRGTMRKKAAPLVADVISSSPLKAPAMTSSPLLTFSQRSFPKGSLMEERFVSARVATNEEMDRKRREEVQMAERRGRKEGKPLLGIISDVAAASSSAAARPVNGFRGSSTNNRV